MRFLDMDGTICESKQIISQKMKKKLSKLGPLVVISGADRKQMEKQLNGLACIILAQSGNDAPDWYNFLSSKETKEIYRHMRKIRDIFDIPLFDETVQDRGCQISLSFTGHDADVKWKQKFDPQQKFRRHVLKHIPFKSKTLAVRIAGTTCLDYNRKGNLKGDNLKRYMKLYNLKKKDCVYYGDALFKGGNDESVLGVMKCVKIKNPGDLYKKLCAE